MQQATGKERGARRHLGGLLLLVDLDHPYGAKEVRNVLLRHALGQAAAGGNGKQGERLMASMLACGELEWAHA
jgi:hypothetical protein